MQILDFKGTQPCYGKVIRRHRMALRLEQEQVGARLGLTGNTVSNWERGISRPDLNLVPALCSYLHIPLEEFFGLPGRKELSAEDKNLLARYNELDKGERQVVRTLIQSLQQARRERQAEELKTLYRSLPAPELALAAGIGFVQDEEPERKLLYVRHNDLSDKADEIYRVNGESMMPLYPDGCRVYVQLDTKLRSGEIGCFVVNGEPYIKRYEKDGLHSLNPAYPCMHFHEGDRVRLIGRVLGRVDEADVANRETAAKLAQID